MDRRPLLRIKARSLQAEAKIIRQEEKKFKNRGPLQESMHTHRKGIVRKVGRETCLALAYLNGTPYKEAERDAAVPPDWARIKEMVARYGTIHQVTHFEDWVPKD